MKIIVFGASGATGKQVVEQALAKGFRVTAFVRQITKLGFAHPALHVLEGDVLQPSAVNAVMAGHDAVICCIGAPANKAFQIRSEGTKNILIAMKNNNVKRLICQSSLGFDDSKPILRNTSFVFRNIIVPLLLKTTFAEHAIQETYIMQSGLNWTIVRCGSMTNAAFTGQYKHGFNYADTTIRVKIARADVADFMLEQLSDERYLQKTAGISY